MIATMPTFGEYIRDIRKRKRLRAYECAERAGISPQDWSEFENDRSRRKNGEPREPRSEMIEKIAVGLDEPLEAVREAALANKRPSFIYFAQDRETGEIAGMGAIESDGNVTDVPDDVKEEIQKLFAVSRDLMRRFNLAPKEEDDER